MSEVKDLKGLSPSTTSGSNIKDKKNNKHIDNGNEIDDNLLKENFEIEYEEDELEKDWSEIIKLNKKNPQMIIPKRGEKDYEPDGTDIQELLLYKARKSMFEALSNSARGTTIKNQVKAVYDFTKHKALVLNPKGSFLQTMGHVTHNGEYWLDFMEFLYLAERGTITPYCLKSNSIPLNNNLSQHDDNDTNLLPLSIEDLYAFFKTQREIDEFSVYAHLKRLGFIVNKVGDDEITFYRKTHKVIRFSNSLGEQQDKLSFMSLIINSILYLNKSHHCLSHVKIIFSMDYFIIHHIINILNIHLLHRFIKI